MSGKARITSNLRLGVSMPALLLCCGTAWAVHSQGAHQMAAAEAVGEDSPSLTQENAPAPVHRKHFARRRKGLHAVSHHQKKKHAPSAPHSDSVAAVHTGRTAHAGAQKHNASLHLHSPHHYIPTAKAKAGKVKVAVAEEDIVPSPELHILAPVAAHYEAVHPAVATSMRHSAARFTPLPWMVEASAAPGLAPLAPLDGGWLPAHAGTHAASSAAPGLAVLAPSAGSDLPATAANTSFSPAPLPWLGKAHVHPETATLMASARVATSAPSLQGVTKIRVIDQQNVAFQALVAADSADAAGTHSLNIMGRMGDQVEAMAEARAQQAQALPPEPSPKQVAQAAPAAEQDIDVAMAEAVPSPSLTHLSPSAGSSSPPASAAPAAAPEPLAISPPIVSSAPPESPGLSAQSKAILDSLPPERETRNRVKPPLHVEHLQKSTMEAADELRQHKGVGISISVHHPKPSTNHLLEEAYDALIAGNQEDAVSLYRQVLDEDPRNKLALFGLATTYHRAGQLALARPLYGRLLAIDPANREGLNNFLVLLSDESPNEALAEMRKLQHTHPDFSPLPAQMAVVYEKLGQYDQAIAQMHHAIDLSPENIKYRYDMAVMLDRRGDWDDASTFYQQLLQANDRGEKIPASPEEIQERLTFIRSNRPTIN